MCLSCTWTQRTDFLIKDCRLHPKIPDILRINSHLLSKVSAIWLINWRGRHHLHSDTINKNPEVLSTVILRAMRLCSVYVCNKQDRKGTYKLTLRRARIIAFWCVLICSHHSVHCAETYFLIVYNRTIECCYYKIHFVQNLQVYSLLNCKRSLMFLDISN
jgi:hypothetical protein